LSIYRPGNSKIFVMDFMFHGQRIRESTGMSSVTRAREVFTKRKRELSDGAAGIKKQQAPRLLSVAAKEGLELKKSKWSTRMQSIAHYALGHLLPVTGKRLLVDIDARDITRYQKVRLAEGASNRTEGVEYTVAALSGSVQ